MSDTSQTPDTAFAQEQAAFSQRILRDKSGVMSIFTMYLGVKLGLYPALVEGGPATSAELAKRTSTQERYIREWLEQQTVAGILEVDDENLPFALRRYSLPPARAEILTDRNSANYMGPMPRIMVGGVKPVAMLLEAFRTGGGVPYDAYGADFREGQAEGNRWAFLHQLAQEWLPAMADVHARLSQDPPARVADIGCGFGWSSIGMAQGYPKILVDGFDLDGPSIERARQNALEHHLAGRLSFQVRDAGDPDLAGQYDLVTAFECLHDMSDPVGALRSMRCLTTNQGTVLIVDELTGERFTAQGTDLEWLMYGWSVLHCLPVGMAGPNSAGTGTLMRPDILRGYAQAAGFSSLVILPVEHPSFRFYRLIR